MRRPQFKRETGLTLAEIGMALFAIGISVLSIATVYLQREHAASINAQQAIAQDLVTDLAARIAARRNADVRFENAVGVRCAAANAGASPQTATTNDVACWQEHVAAELPNGSGSVTLDGSTVPATYAITVSWSQPRGGVVSYTVRAPAAFASNVLRSP